MNTRRATLLIVSLPAVIAILLWVFSARIAGLLVPPLLNRDSIRITSLDIASIGLDHARVHRLTGSAHTGAGSATFDIRDALVYYDLSHLEPGRIRIGSARIEHDPAPAPGEGDIDMSTIVLPSPVTVDRLRLNYGDLYEFRGSVSFSGTEEAFTVNAIDENSHLVIEGDASLSSFDLTLTGPGQEHIGSGRIDLGDSLPDAFTLDLNLAPAVQWMRATSYVPADLVSRLNDVDSVSGSVKLEGYADDQDRWNVAVDLDLQRLATKQFNASGKLSGAVVPEDDGWVFAISRDGEVQLTTVDDMLTDVFSLSADLAKGYAVSAVKTGDDFGRIGGAGDAAVSFYRSDGVDLTARLKEWSLEDMERVRFRLTGVEIVEPFEISVGEIVSNSTLGAAPAGDASLSRVKLQPWPEDIAPADVRLDWEWKEGSLAGSGTARLGGPPELTWTLSSRGSRGQVKLDLSSTLPELAMPFRRFLKSNDYDLEFFDGSASGTLNWSWDDDRYDNNMVFRTTDFSGRFLGLDFENAKLDLKSSDLVAPTLQFSVTAPSITLANDVVVSGISAAGRWQSGLHLDQARFSTLGGSIKINPFFMDPDKPAVSAELEISEIDLGQIMAMVDQSGLEASGRLSGSIPLQLKESAVAIRDGHLRNTTLGHISYDAGEEAAAQLNNIAVQALTDFRYDLIDATLNYQFDGAYSIRARIEGKNPSLYDGYPVAFNLNLSGTLPGLMQASLITGDFHSEILKQIKSGE